MFNGNKSEFRSAYEAGKQAYRNRAASESWTEWLVFCLAIIIASVLCRIFNLGVWQTLGISIALMVIISLVARRVGRRRN